MPRMLIVEDEPNAREALGEVFRAKYEVRLAEDFMRRPLRTPSRLCASALKYGVRHTLR